MDVISPIVEIVDKIHTHSEQLKRNKAHFRQLSRQAEAIVEDIRGHYATADGSDIQLPPKVVDGLSRMELILGRILRVLEKERQRNSFMAWIRAGDQATVCADLSEELSTCASLINLSTSIHVLGETRVISSNQERLALQDDQLLHNLSSRARLVAQIQKKWTDLSHSLPAGTRRHSGTHGFPLSFEGEPSSFTSRLASITSFLSFLECLDSPSLNEPSSSFHDALSFFFRHVQSRHQGGSVCYAAIETFAVDYQNEIKVVVCVAVLKEEYDLRLPKPRASMGSANRCRAEFIFEFTLLDVSHAGPSASPSDWIQVQGSADYFDRERTCFALWDLGRLPPGPHLPDSESFRWIKQSVTAFPARTGGSTLMVDIESGNSMHSFRRFHQLNARIAHPANAERRLELVEHHDQDIRRACEDTNEEWFIALLLQLPLVLEPEGKKRYIMAHQTYVVAAMKLDIERFASMGIDSPLFEGETTDTQKNFLELYDEALEAVAQLFKPLYATISAGASNIWKAFGAVNILGQLAYARAIGRLWWKIHTTIVLLKPEQRKASSTFMRSPLAGIRRELAESSYPFPPLIWNYIPPYLTARARYRKAQIDSSAASETSVSSSH